MLGNTAYWCCGGMCMEGRGQLAVLSCSHVGPWHWTQDEGLAASIFPAELFQQLGLCISENSLRNHECNLAVGILRAAKKVISSEQLWEKRPNYYPHLPRETRESRWLRTELFLELKSAFVEAYALNAHTPVPPQTSFFYAFHLDLLSHGFLRINLCILWR